MEIIEEYLEYLNEIEPVTTALAAAAVAKPLFAAGVALSAANLSLQASRFYKEYFTKAARKCKDLTPKEKSICMVRAKMLAKNAQLQKLKQGMAKCAKARNAEKCKQKLSVKMQKLAQEVSFLSDRMKEIRQQHYQ
jgi:hypothetical protein